MGDTRPGGYVCFEVLYNAAWVRLCELPEREGPGIRQRLAEEGRTEHGAYIEIVAAA